MDDQMVIIDGSVFCVSQPNGDISASGEPDGLFVRDMRHLSRWQLLINDVPTRLLTGRALDHRSARFFLSEGWARIGHDPDLSVCRERRVDDGFHEDLLVVNHSTERRQVRLELQYGADFADLFEVKDLKPKRGKRHIETAGSEARLWYEREDFRRHTVITFSQAPDWARDREAAAFSLDLSPGDHWHLAVDMVCRGDGIETAHGVARRRANPTRPPVIETDWGDLDHAVERSLFDLNALRFRPFVDESWAVPAAGLPWFMALFGRDALITSYQALPFDAGLAQATLESLGRLQAHVVDDYRDAEPGKICHELRTGELAWFHEVPHTPYYGSHDTTPLFLVLLDEYERWTGDLELVRRLEPAARAAIEWLDRYGDLDGDGYLEYRRRSPNGLVNQFWKDSWNSVMFADGHLAEAPIGPCDVQGYGYAARRGAARLAREAWGDPGLAGRLDAAAEECRRRFDDGYWCRSRGHHALALDGAKDQVDSLTSNIGHLLWTGILDQDRASAVVERLMSEEMFSGWGIRTMSSRDAGYSPIGYHNGTVWPHDTGIVAEGLRRYGFRDEASRLVTAMIDAAGFFDGRLPEAFAGFGRDENPFPVEYPTASRPQAWAAGAPLLAVRTLLGLDVVDGRLCADSNLPAGRRRLHLRSVVFRGTHVDVP